MCVSVCVCVCVCVCARARVLSLFRHVWLCATPWTVACQTPLSMGFSRQEYWSGLPFPPPGDLPDPGTKPASLMSPALADSLPLNLQGSPGFFSPCWPDYHSIFSPVPIYFCHGLAVLIRKLLLVSYLLQFWLLTFQVSPTHLVSHIFLSNLPFWIKFVMHDPCGDEQALLCSLLGKEIK